MTKLLVTGGAGFIGSAFIRLSLAADPSVRIVNLDKLTYAGNLENLESVATDPRYRFVHGDICDESLVDAVLSDEHPDAIVHFAAESHVDRSILEPSPVFETNLRGTFTLLEAARRHNTARYLQVSTDEVYGRLAAPLEADENFPLNPSSPYSASKAGADMLARSYFLTYKSPVVITRASNNYGPYHFPEKLIPLMISNALEDRPLPEDHLNEILEAGRRAPSARNGQPWDFVVSTEREQLVKLAQTWQGAGHVAHSAATIVLVASPPGDDRRRDRGRAHRRVRQPRRERRRGGWRLDPARPPGSARRRRDRLPVRHDLDHPVGHRPYRGAAGEPRRRGRRPRSRRARRGRLPAGRTGSRRDERRHGGRSRRAARN